MLEIKKHMEELREELNKLINEKDHDEERLLQLSKELDNVICKYIEAKGKCNKYYGA